MPLEPLESQRQFRFNIALELAIVLLVIGVCMAVLLTQLDAMVFKARFAEALLEFRTPQAERVEKLALTGDISQGGFAALASLHHDPRRIDLTVRAAIREGAEPANVIWLCGERATPPGWIASGPPAPANLPPAYLISQCRKDGAQ
jgi:hypothetical protein